MIKAHSLQIMDSVPSTMDVARENILTGRVYFLPSGEPNYGGVLAKEQTAGRGQRGRIWYAEPGANLNVTYYFRQGMTDPEHAGEISLLAGVAVRYGLSGVALPADKDSAFDLDAFTFGLKWPNDVLLKGKKVGGILIEMVKAPDGDWVALIGVGINLSVQEFPPKLANTATSLLREGLAPPEAETLAAAILSELHRQAENRRDSGFSGILHDWRQNDRTVGQLFETEIAGERFFGVAEGVDENGGLLLRAADGRLVTVTSATSLRSADREPIL